MSEPVLEPPFDRLREGMILHRKGRLSEAESIYRDVLADHPDQPDALHMLGLIAHATGAREQAISLIQQAIEIVPNFADARNSLGVVLKAMGRTEEAIASYRRAIDLRPHYPEASRNLEAALQSLGRTAEAEKAVAVRVTATPDNAGGYIDLGYTLFHNKRFDEALTAFTKALELDPNSAAAHRNLWSTYSRLDRPEEAKAVLRSWVQRCPDDQFASYMMAAETGEQTPSQAPQTVIVDIFGKMSERFDDTLQGLGYRGPDLVEGALWAAVGDPAAMLDILDAGCGTGLCCAGLKPYARKLEGVDLSGQMLARARARGGYDELIEAELTAFLAGHSTRWDAIVSADTLNYFGDLSGVCGAAAKALRPSGLFVFTLEAGENRPSRYELHKGARFRHDETYVRQTLEAAGLKIARIGFEVLRFEKLQPVECFVFTALKPAS